ncbi:hypothetical protein EYF80_050515 [Liparis tanakae]|uniref:Uncharacterized protein n=1 Tax=Liparis tanakae TaxID=230148 RepID=A0A4Z2FEJ9_9TELE|nr:hypothetical protein EYF80_050515 [Liparis tanakae]
MTSYLLNTRGLTEKTSSSQRVGLNERGKMAAVAPPSRPSPSPSGRCAVAESELPGNGNSNTVYLTG